MCRIVNFVPYDVLVKRLPITRWHAYVACLMVLTVPLWPEGPFRISLYCNRELFPFCVDLARDLPSMNTIVVCPNIFEVLAIAGAQIERMV